MGREGLSLVMIAMVLAMGLSLLVGRNEAAVSLPPEAKALQRHFYKKHNICRVIEPYVAHQVKLWWTKDKSITAKLVKLLYSDCMVNGCDGSVLLDGQHTEKTATQNSGLGQDVYTLIDKIKIVVDIYCKKPVVSCSDILNLATRDALQLSGSASYPVFLGRRDGTESNAAWVDLPPPSVTWDEGLAYFVSKGLDLQDYVTLLGSHTMGKTHCAYIHDRLYNYNNTRKPDPSMRKATVDKLTKVCPETLGKGKQDPTVFLTDSKYRFTNSYYKHVLSSDTVLGVDQQTLYNYNMTQFVLEYAAKLDHFKQGHALSISRMGSLKILTGTRGEIRRNCRFTNKDNPHIK